MSDLIVKGIPESITKEAANKAAELLGFDPSNLLSISLDRGIVRAEVRAVDSQGNPVFDRSGGVFCRVEIPLSDD